MNDNAFRRVPPAPKRPFVIPKQQRSETVCEVHVHQEHVPWERHHIIPEAWHGPSEDWNFADVCSNAHGNIHYLLNTLLKTGLSDLGAAISLVGWDYVGTFGHKTRDIAYAGFRGIMTAVPTTLPSGLIVLEFPAPKHTRAGGLSRVA